MRTDHLKEREAAISQRLAALSERELVHLIHTLQNKPLRNRRDALYTSRYIRMARRVLRERRGQ